jgi:hypothetical protein
MSPLKARIFEPSGIRGIYEVGVAGLNLQRLCHFVVGYGSAPKKGIQDQALGRIRRLEEDHAVRRISISVEQSFHLQVINNATLKAVPAPRLSS